MKLRLRRQENDAGEWSVLDPALDYRICHYNHPHHAGPHLHHPAEAKAGGNVDIPSAADAETVMRRYHRKHGSFSPKKFNEEVKTWKSESESN